MYYIIHLMYTDKVIVIESYLIWFIEFYVRSCDQTFYINTLQNHL